MASLSRLVLLPGYHAGRTRRFADVEHQDGSRSGFSITHQTTFPDDDVAAEGESERITLCHVVSRSSTHEQISKRRLHPHINMLSPVLLLLLAANLFIANLIDMSRRTLRLRTAMATLTREQTFIKTSPPSKHLTFVDMPGEIQGKILEFAAAQHSRHSARKTIQLGSCSRAVWRIAPYYKISSLLCVSRGINEHVTRILTTKGADLGVTIYFHCLDSSGSDLEIFDQPAFLPPCFTKFASTLSMNFSVLHGCTKVKRAAQAEDDDLKEQISMARAVSVGRE